MSIQNELIDALAVELKQRKSYLAEQVDTIYLGGGTPSLLTKDQLSKLLETISNCFEVAENVEITIEANPEDLDLEKLSSIKEVGFNRLSIGIQTFDDNRLQWMNRIHNREQAIDAYNRAREAGFSNISLDLIYALPDTGFEGWKRDLKQIIQLQPQHISLYGLTIEEKTVFGNWSRKGKLEEIPENEAADQYLHSINFLKSHGYVQYEVSNFGKPGYYSRHNSSYWKGVPYLGVGPGAHSFDGKSRQLNIRNNHKYVRLIKDNESFYELETLTKVQLLNERILTSLRTQEGIDLNHLNEAFDVDLMTEYSSLLDELQRMDYLIISDGFIRLIANGFLVADEIALRMFFPE